jgi:hypothetical protein
LNFMQLREWIFVYIFGVSDEFCGCRIDGLAIVYADRL